MPTGWGCGGSWGLVYQLHYANLLQDHLTPSTELTAVAAREP